MTNSKYSSIWFPTSQSICQHSPYHGRLKLKQLWQSKKLWKELKCGKGGPVSELDRQLGDEMKKEEEFMGIGRLKEKCKEVSSGIAELLECLEREAIMGEDEGREPTDYNRRAQIFDKSSRVFQALKEKADGGSSNP